MSIAGKIMEFIAGCPHLKEFEEMFPVVYIDKLEENATAYSIETTPAEPVIKRYANGDTLRQYVFSLCSREMYGPAENVDTTEFYEKFSDWLDACTEREDLPQLSGQMMSKSIQATTDGYLYDTQANKCQYRIQCKFIYYKRR